MSAGTELPRSPTGVAGLDAATGGGLPAGRTTVVRGARGTGKTVLALHLVSHAARALGERAVVVSFDEAPSDLAMNARTLGVDLPQLVAAAHIAIVDATTSPHELSVVVGEYDLSGLQARTESAVERIGATLVLFDAAERLLLEPYRAGVTGPELARVCAALRRRGVASLITTAARPDRDREHAQRVDNMIVLRRRRRGDDRRGTLEVEMLRGAAHHHGELAFVIDPERGVTVGDAATPA